MQSRAITETASRARWIFSAITHKETPLWVRTTKSMSRTADPAIHSEDSDGIKAEEATKAALAEEEQKQNKDQSYKTKISEENELLKPTTPIASSPSLTSTEVTRPADPLTQQQKRSYSSVSSSSYDVLDQVSCVGIDGEPLPKQSERSSQEDNREYFKDHKASPLSNIEMVDTRKLITRATDGTATNYYKGYGGETMVFEVVMESADETFERAIRLWRDRAMRSWDPDAPHSRAVIAALSARGELISDLIESPISA